MYYIQVSRTTPSLTFERGCGLGIGPKTHIKEPKGNERVYVE